MIHNPAKSAKNEAIIWKKSCGNLDRKFYVKSAKINGFIEIERDHHMQNSIFQLDAFSATVLNTFFLFILTPVWRFLKNFVTLFKANWKKRNLSRQFFVSFLIPLCFIIGPFSDFVVTIKRRIEKKTFSSILSVSFCVNTD